MTDNFQQCLTLVRKEEGGNSDDPHDHGGRTSRGITQREYNAYRAANGLKSADVWKATDKDINAIYREQYWEPYCPDMPPGVDLVFFDFNVNAGRAQAVKTLQRCLGVTADGMLGMLTRQAVENCQNIGGLIHDYSERRRAFYRALKQFPRYGKGWLARVDRIEHAAASMAQVVSYPSGAPAASPKANPDEASHAAVSPEAGAAAATSSTVGVGLVDQVQQATQHLTPFQDSIKIVKYILIAVALIGFGFTVYGIVRRRKNQEAIG